MTDYGHEQGRGRARRLTATTLSVTVADSPFGPVAGRSGVPSRSVRHCPGLRSSAAKVSSGVGKRG